MFDNVTGQGDGEVKLKAAARTLICLNKIEGGFVIINKMKSPDRFLTFFKTLTEETTSASQARGVSRLLQESLTENIPNNILSQVLIMEMKMHVRTGNQMGFISCINRAYHLVRKGRLDTSLFPFSRPFIPTPSLS